MRMVLCLAVSPLYTDNQRVLYRVHEEDDVCMHPSLGFSTELKGENAKKSAVSDSFNGR